MKKYLVAMALVSAGISVPATAQLAVIDKSNLLKAVDTARNTLTMIDKAQEQIAEAQQLYSSMNGITDIPQMARELASEQLTMSRPYGVDDQIILVDGNLDQLGSVGVRARDLISGANLSVDPYGRGDSMSPSIDYGYEEAARRQAIAEARLTNYDDMSEGITRLGQRLETAETQKEVQDIQSKLLEYSAQVQNETNRLKALEMAQMANETRQQKESYAARLRVNKATREAAAEAVRTGGR